MRTHDARGHRADRVEFHPACHALTAASVADGLHASVWDGAEPEKPRARGHLARAARQYIGPASRGGASVADLADGAEGLPGVREAAADIVAALQAPEALARFATGRLAAAAALAACAPPAVAEAYAEAYAATRLARERATYGANGVGAVTGMLLERALT